MNEIKDIARGDRCPGISYTDMLNGDTRRAPDYLFEESHIAMGDDPLPVAPYISEEFARLEREKMWPNVWLFAAREDEMPDAGDTVVFDIAGKSFLLIRQKDGGVKAFYNACLHRGRKLRTSASVGCDIILFASAMSCDTAKLNHSVFSQCNTRVTTTHKAIPTLKTPQ